MIENEKCECHKCVFLRASQFDRQLLDISLRAEIEDVLSKSEPLPKKPSERVDELKNITHKKFGNGYVAYCAAIVEYLDEQFEKSNSK